MQSEWKGKVATERVAGVKRAIESGLGVSHLRCLFTPLFIHCHPQLIPPGDGAACPPQGPQAHPGPLWMPNWAYRSPDWINSSVSGTFSPLQRRREGGGVKRYTPQKWSPVWSSRHQSWRERERRRGGRIKSKGSSGGVVETVQKNMALSVSEPRLEGLAGGAGGPGLHRPRGFQQGSKRPGEEKRQTVAEDTSRHRRTPLELYLSNNPCETSSFPLFLFCFVLF